MRCVKFEEFKKMQKYVISGYEEDLEEEEISKLIHI